jgi:hypothetical protein
LTNLSHSGERLLRVPFLSPEPVCNPSREQQSVQSALVFDQHPVR